MVRQLTAIIEREGDGYVALCPDVDIASQGATVGEARDNLKEALELFFETASATEIQRRHETPSGSPRSPSCMTRWISSMFRMSTSGSRVRGDSCIKWARTTARTTVPVAVTDFLETRR